ncbi:MAG: membrane dipeptidase [Ignavibacteriales bacterium]|nr:membrane dipeptidase [Ignavibacteriales bacterium]
MAFRKYALALSLVFLAPALLAQSELDEFHQTLLTVDSHVDTPLRLVRSDFDLDVRHDGRASGGGRLDFPRMREGGLDAVFFAAYVRQDDLTPEKRTAALERVETLLRISKRAAADSDIAEIALEADDAARIAAKDNVAVFLGVENGYAVGVDLENVRRLYDQGARYITLCHVENNDICDSSTDEGGPLHDGLSAFGERVVREMNRLGMIVDLSHVSDETVRDVLTLSDAPVIASHSACRALHNHPRNLPDDLLRGIAENGGVLQICLFSGYLKKIEKNPAQEEEIRKLRERYNNFEGLSDEDYKIAVAEWESIHEKHPNEKATVDDLLDHVDHAVEVMGVDHVGIGSDFDGGGELADVYDVSQFPLVTKGLRERGYSDEEIAKIWGGNFFRVFREVERVAETAR